MLYTYDSNIGFIFRFLYCFIYLMSFIYEIIAASKIRRLNFSLKINRTQFRKVISVIWCTFFYKILFVYQNKSSKLEKT